MFTTPDPTESCSQVGNWRGSSRRISVAFNNHLHVSFRFLFMLCYSWDGRCGALLTVTNMLENDEADRLLEIPAWGGAWFEGNALL
jgi:hypothetical protein